MDAMLSVWRTLVTLDLVGMTKVCISFNKNIPNSQCLVRQSIANTTRMHLIFTDQQWKYWQSHLSRKIGQFSWRHSQRLLVHDGHPRQTARARLLHVRGRGNHFFLSFKSWGAATSREQLKETCLLWWWTSFDWIFKQLYQVLFDGRAI